MTTPFLSKPLIGKKIRRLRVDLGLSQQELAEKLGTPGAQAEVSKWERGVEAPGRDKLRAIAALAGRGLDMFQAEEAESGSPPRAASQVREAAAEDRVAAANGKLDLSAELARINALPIEEWQKDMKIAQLEALARAEAMSADARAREADAKAADQRARAARVAALVDLNRTRFLSRVEDAAMREAARLRESERLRRSQEGKAQSAEGTG